MEKVAGFFEVLTPPNQGVNSREQSVIRARRGRALNGVFTMSAHRSLHHSTGRDAMAPFSLREAAQQARTSKSTILRAVQSGRLSAARTDAGGYAIDPAELFRVYPPKGSAGAAEQPAHQSVGQDAPAPATPPVADDVAQRFAVLDAEVKGMRELLAEVRQSRDDWKAQAERLALTGPGERRGFWRRIVGG